MIEMICILCFAFNMFTSAEKRQLLVIMIDGARWDYVDLLERDELGGFSYFKYMGVRTEYVEPIFPSSSYPAWTSLSTGLYPENHGIIGNVMYDEEHDLQFTLNLLNVTKLPFWWQDVESIWTTATKAGLRVATLEWSRSDIPYHGVLPELAIGYAGSQKDIEEKLREAYVCIKQGFDLIMVYYEQIDSAGHGFGAASQIVMTLMKRIANALDVFFKALFSAGLAESVDTIIVSDHGMSSTCSLPLLNISHFIDVKADTRKVICESTLISIFAKRGLELKLHNQLKGIRNFNIKYRYEIPGRFHYKKAKRAPDLLLYADPVNSGSQCMYARGVHGYDPLIEDMHGIFLAFGKSFTSGGLVMEPIKMVDIYQIYCHILNIEPQPHNGTWENVKYMLYEDIDSQERQDYLLERKIFTRLWEERFEDIREKKYYSNVNWQRRLGYSNETECGELFELEQCCQ